MEYKGILKSVVLFNGIAFDELRTMLICIDARVKNFQKDEAVLLAGDTPNFVGIALSGKFHIVRENVDGDSTFVETIMPGGVFAEMLCGADISVSPITIFARTGSTAMLLDFSRILHTCSNVCPFHTKLIKNIFRSVASKSLELHTRIETVNMKSMRTKIIHFLSSFALSHSQDILIPYNREEMADFLCVSRSALSRELSRMKSDGLIEYKKNRFKILRKMQV